MVGGWDGDRKSNLESAAIQTSRSRPIVHGNGGPVGRGGFYGNYAGKLRTVPRAGSSHWSYFPTPKHQTAIPRA